MTGLPPAAPHASRGIRHGRLPAVHRRRVQRRRVRRDLRHLRPGHGREDRRRRQGRPGRRRPGHRGGPQGVRRGPLAQDVRRRARRQAAPDRRADRRQRGRAGRDRGQDGGGTIKKAMFADVPGAQSAFEWFAQLRRDAARPGRPRRLARSRASQQLRPLRAHRRVHRHHPVELPADHGRLEDRPVAGRRQLRGHQAGVVHVDHRARAGAALRRRPTSRRASSTSSPARAAPSARSWPATRWSTRPRSPARPRSAAASCSSRRAP